MARSPRTYAVVLSLGLALSSAGTIAQQRPPTQAPSHKHYEASAAFDQTGPGGEIAPRLQNLGTHTFQVSTTNARAQQFFNQGFNVSYAFKKAWARADVQLTASRLAK
jgi:hypothetical protein